MNSSEKEQLIKDILYACLIESGEFKGRDTLVWNLKSYARDCMFEIEGLMLKTRLKQTRPDLYELICAEQEIAYKENKEENVYS